MGFTTRGVGAATTSVPWLDGLGVTSDIPLANAHLPSGRAPRGLSVGSLTQPPSLARHASLGVPCGRLPLAPSPAGEDPQIEPSDSLRTAPSGPIR